MMRLGKTLSPPPPEKIDFVREGTNKIPTANTPMTTSDWSPYNMYWSSVIPGGSVVRYWKMNRSKIIKNANAITGINEYCTNALNHDQKSQSSFGTMKNGTKIGPTKAQTALAIKPNATTASEMTFASVTTINS